MQKSRVRQFGALLVGLGLLATACGSDEKDGTGTTPAVTTPAVTEPAGTDPAGTTPTATDPAGEGVTCDGGATLAFLGALSGDNGALGQNMINGGQIAIDEFNAANPGCQVTFDTSYDSQGDPAQAGPLADAIVNNDKIIGLLGPGFSGETNATGPTFDGAGLGFVSPSATNVKLSTNGWKVFHRVLANDGLQAPGVVTLIKDTVKATKVGVIDDASDYGKGLADAVRDGLGDLDVADATIDPKAADYSAAVTAMADAGVDTVFYGGYYAEAAKLVQQLRDAGVTATFVAGDGVLDPAFVENGGEATDGAYVTATGAPSDINPEFAAAYEAKFGTPPGLYSPESYDAVNIMLAGIAAGNLDRESLNTFISAFDGEGITKHLKFDETGEVAGSAVYYSVVEGGALVAKGLIGG